MKKTNNQEFNPDTLDNTAPEPSVDTSVDAGEQDTENCQEGSESDKMTEEKTDWQDKYMRLSAEFDNYRKRTAKEKMEIIATGGADVLKAMLSTADDFDRALAHIKSDADREGVELIYNKFSATLKSKGVEPMELVGKPFDVDFAEAIAKFPAPSPEQSGTVIDIAQKGYMIKDKVLRFAQVVVAE